MDPTVASARTRLACRFASNRGISSGFPLGIAVARDALMRLLLATSLVLFAVGRVADGEPAPAPSLSVSAVASQPARRAQLSSEEMSALRQSVIDHPRLR